MIEIFLLDNASRARARIFLMSLGGVVCADLDGLSVLGGESGVEACCKCGVAVGVWCFPFLVFQNGIPRESTVWKF